MSNQDRLLSDEELTRSLQSIIGNVSQPEKLFPTDIENKVASGDKALNKLTDLINTQKRLYAESVIGEDVPFDGAEVVRSTSGEIKGRGAGSYYLQAQRELRAEQRARIK